MELLPALAGPVIGGLLGSQSSGNTQTAQQSLDPRIQAILYGSGADKGLLGDANALRQQQLSTGGLNANQTAGLEMQRQSLLSPQYTQGYDQMRNVGSQLLNAGVAGNPFANNGNGYIGGGLSFGNTTSRPGNLQQSVRPQAMAQMQPFQYQQNAATQGASNPLANSMPSYAQPAMGTMQPDQTELQKYLAQIAEEKRIARFTPDSSA